MNFRVFIGGLLVFFNASAALCIGQQGVPSPGPIPRVYEFFQRTPSHVRLGRSESFQAIADLVQHALNAGNVAVAPDPSGGNTYSEGDMSLDLVRDMARKAGATYLLYVVVDRPHTRWIKVTLHLYEVNGRELWAQEASPRTYLSSTANREIVERVGVLLKERIGGPGLPIVATAAKSAEAAPAAQ